MTAWSVGVHSRDGQLACLRLHRTYVNDPLSFSAYTTIIYLLLHISTNLAHYFTRQWRRKYCEHCTLARVTLEGRKMTVRRLDFIGTAASMDWQTHSLEPFYRQRYQGVERQYGKSLFWPTYTLITWFISKGIGVESVTETKQQPRRRGRRLMK